MASLGQTFDPNSVEPAQAREALPTDFYLVEILDSRWKENRNGNGAGLEFTLKVIQGPHKGRQVWDNMQLRNTSSETARQIAEKRLSSLVRSTVERPISDSSELHGRVCMAHVKYRPAEGSFKASNEVDAYTKPEGAAGVPAGAPAAPAQAAAPWGGGAAPAQTPAPAPAPAQVAQTPPPAAPGGAAPPWATRT